MEDKLFCWVLVVLSLAVLLFAGRIVDAGEKIIKVFKIDWLIKTLCYAFLVALIPGFIWLFLGILSDILDLIIAKANSFHSLPWNVKIPIFIIIGFIIQGVVSLREKKQPKNVEKE